MRILAVALATLTVSSLGSVAEAVPPTNDICAAATPIEIGASSVNFDITDATNTGPFAVLPCGGGGRDVWYRVDTETCAGRMRISTTDGFAIGVYEGCPLVGGGRLVACSETNGPSTLVGFPSTGLQYYIRVYEDTFTHTSGSFEIESCVAESDCTCLTDDTCLVEQPSLRDGDNYFHWDMTPPASSTYVTSCLPLALHTDYPNRMWYVYQATCDGLLEIESLDSFTVSHLCGQEPFACLDNRPPISGAHDYDSVMFPVVAGDLLHIQMIGTSQSDEATYIRCEPSIRPNDECTGAESITLESVINEDGSEFHARELAVSTYGDAAYNWDPDCSDFTPAFTPDAWFEWVAPCSGNAAIDFQPTTGLGVTNFLVAEIYTDCQTGQAHACRSDDGPVEFPVMQGVTYYIRVYSRVGVEAFTDRMQISLECQANDDCAGAEPLVTGENFVTTVGATFSGSDSSCSIPALAEGAADSWYRFSVGCYATVTLSIVPDSDDLVFALYDECGGNEILCNSAYHPTSSVVLNADEDYYVRIFGFNGTQGSATLDLDIECYQIPFVRADLNGDGIPGLSDVIELLEVMFSGAQTQCLEAADIVPDGSLNLTDFIHLVSYLYTQGPPPAAPFPGCGVSDDPDGVGTAFGCEDLSDACQ